MNKGNIYFQIENPINDFVGISCDIFVKLNKKFNLSPCNDGIVNE